MASIFDKLIANELPCHVVFEDKHTLAFLDIAPVAEGHTLVIHKTDRSAELSSMRPQAAAQLMQTAQRVITLLKSKLGAQGVNMLLAEGGVAGQEVMHAHIHVIPRYADDGLKLHNVGAKKASEESLAALAKNLYS